MVSDSATKWLSSQIVGIGYRGPILDTASEFQLLNVSSVSMIQSFSVSVSCDSIVLSLLVISVLCLSVCQYFYISNVCSVSVTVLGIQCFFMDFPVSIRKRASVPSFSVVAFSVLHCFNVSVFQCCRFPVFSISSDFHTHSTQKPFSPILCLAWGLPSVNHKRSHCCWEH